MELKEFLKQRDTTEYIDTDGGYYKTHDTLLDNIKKKIEECVAGGYADETIKEAVEREVRDYQPINRKLNRRVNALMKKWGIPEVDR